MERIVRPFGVAVKGADGFLEGYKCSIVTIAEHTETHEKEVVYKLEQEDTIKVMKFGKFVAKGDSNLRNIVMNFKNWKVDDDCPYSNYRHFKGKWYRLIAIAEDTCGKFCIYKPLYGDLTLTWCRPYDMFFSEVDHEKYPDVEQKWRLMNSDELIHDFGTIRTKKMIEEEMKEFLEGVRQC